MFSIPHDQIVPRLDLVPGYIYIYIRLGPNCFIDHSFSEEAKVTLGHDCQSAPKICRIGVALNIMILRNS